MYQKILVTAIASLLLFGFTACLKEDAQVLGDDPLALRVETDPQGNQFLQWNALNISRFQKYDVQISTDSGFLFNVNLDTSLFGYNETRTRLNLNSFPLNRYQYFRVVASTIDNKFLFSKTVSSENTKVFNLPFSQNLDRIYASPDSKYLICQSNNTLVCLDLESQQVKGTTVIPNGINFNGVKFSFSTKNGESFFLFIPEPSQSNLKTFNLPDMVPVASSVLNTSSNSPFIAIDDTDYVVTYNPDSWPYSLHLVDRKTGNVLDKLETAAWQSNTSTQAFVLTDIERKEFVHHRSDSLIKYVITSNGKIQALKGVKNLFPSTSNQNSNNRVIQDLKEGKYFNTSNYIWGQSNSVGVHSIDLDNSFETPNSALWFQHQIIYSVLSKDGNFIYTIYRHGSTSNTHIRKTMLDDKTILIDKSLSNSTIGDFASLFERPEGMYLFGRVGAELVFLKLEL